MMNSKIETLAGWSMILGVPALAFVLLMLTFAHGNFVRGKQVTFDRAEADLLSALAENQVGNPQPKRYQHFQIYPATNEIALNGKTYTLAFYTADEFQFAKQGRLGITKDRQFVWLDDLRGAKLIRENYKVSGWRSGF